ncbi:glycosyltransferase family 2 protein [Rhodanobacter sp. DHG33]|uniref:glycosyltransferase family 2 protein n=1 Tax=Rhodanobacter sp. DHG33 TaxID=2775921 RepID=UPI00177C460F|nr:glycosyltransferase family 2 protein [Rhodanobacter sp. DHG33]MBD8897669.1 glycosyltransferase family 2 protein [Rhodanobacter sp. DHG33]
MEAQARHSTRLISLVVPFYNESAVIEDFFHAVPPVLASIERVDYEIVCVNDGSKDDTLALLCAAAHTDSRIRVVDLSRNFGKEAAMTAGIDIAKGDAVIPFDADLQDPPELIPELVRKWQEGFDVVIARRIERSSDTYAKRLTAALFYRFHNAIADVKIPENAGDFRLMARQVVDELKRLPESRRFMKGLFAWVGFTQTYVDYVRQPRVAGKTKFSGWRLWNFALEGVTSFSTLPLRVWTYLGTVSALVSMLYAIYLVARTVVHGRDLPGYASIITAVLFLGGIQLIGIGVIGEYIGRIYIESKRRPVYVIRHVFQKPEKS